VLVHVVLPGCPVATRNYKLQAVKI